MMTEMEFLVAFNSAAGAYQAETGGGSLAPWGYTHEQTWQDAATGFKARAYSDGASNYILAFAGTEDFQDAYQDLANFGMAQWNAEGPFILEFFNDIKNDPNKGLNSIQFTGHSLGGALAQYAAYDFVSVVDGSPIISANNVTLTTFNALGGELGLKNKFTTEYNPNILVNANIHHYFDPSDLVSRLSPHLGGQATNYQLRSSTDPIFTFDSHILSQIQSYIADGTLRTDLQASHNYFEIDKLAEALQIWGENMKGWTENNHEVSDAEAAARIISMVSIIPYVSESDQWGELKKFLIDNLVRTSLAPKFGITSEIGIASLKISMDTAIQVVGKSIAKPGTQAFFQGGAQLTIYLSEAYEFMSGGPELDPAEKALTYSLLNYISGSTLSIDENGHFDERVNSNVALKIFQMSHLDDRSAFPKLIKDIGALLGQNINENYEDAIGLVNRIVEEGIVLADSIVSADSYTDERLLNILNEEPSFESITVDTLDARLVRYTIINRLPFLLEDVRAEFLDPSILNAQRYALTEESEQYWGHRLEFFRQTLRQNDAGHIVIFDENEYKYFRDYEGGQLLVGKNTFGQGGSNTLQVSDVSNVRFGSESDDADISGYGKGDFLYGEAGNDTINGNAGRDHLEGNTGNDTLHGGTESDYLYGGKGNDHLHGDEGNDYLLGGEGSDTYYYVNNATQFDGHDQIKDIDAGDRLNINGHLISNLTEFNSQGSSDKTYKDDYGNIYALGATGGLIITVISDSKSGTIEINQFNKTTNNFGLTFNEAEESEIPELESDTYNVGNGLIDGRPLEENYYYRANVSDQAFVNDKSIIFNATQASPAYHYDDPTKSYYFNGGMQNDQLTGGILFDVLHGLEGDDYLEGLDNNDRLNGGEGSDYLLGGEGSDFIWGNEQRALDENGLPKNNYQPESASTSDYIEGENGDDHISADEGDDTAFGGLGRDTIAGGKGSDKLFGGDGDDKIYGDSYRQYYLISNGLATTNTDYLSDKEEGHTYDDVIDGGAGHDTLLGEIGNDTIIGGSGDDWIHGDRHNRAESLIIDDEIDTQFQLLAPELHGDDVLMGGSGIDTILGDAGDDYLDGGSENDILWGDDIYIAGEHHGKDTLLGGIGNDIAIGGGQDDFIDGGEGNDTLMGDESIYDDQTEMLLDGEYHGKDEIHGGLGNDTIIGGGKDDVLYGDEGDDYIWGDSKFAPQDVFAAGKELAIPDSSWWLDKAFHGNDEIYAGSGDDRVYGGGGSDKIYGGSGTDELLGQDGDDILYGETGNDILFGGNGSDTVYGGSGNDTIYGGAGDDILHAGSGQDYLNGDAGNDTYVFNLGDGASTIDDADGQNTLVFNHITDPNNIKIYGGKEYSIIQYGSDVSDKVFLTNETYLKLSGITLGDGSILDSNPIQIAAIDSSREITGTQGNDNFMMNSGFGSLTLVNNGDETTTDVLTFGEGITADNIELSYQYDNYGVPLDTNPDRHTVKVTLESGDVLTLKNFMQESEAPSIDRFEFQDETVWTLADFKESLFTGIDNDESIGGSPWSDVISGGKGNDSLNGFGGNDIYRFNRGDGHDTIQTTYGGRFVSDEKIIEFGADILPEDIVVVHSPRDARYAQYSIDSLSLYIKDSSDQLTVRYYINNNSVESNFTIRFSSTNEEWNRVDIAKRIHASEYADRVEGSYRDDALDGLGGNDYLHGYSGDDVLVGGDGDDHIFGGSGHDDLYGGAGDDRLSGEEGQDRLEGGAGNDIYYFDNDFGIDTIKDESGNDRINFSVLGYVGPNYYRDDSNLIISFDSENQVIVESFFSFDGEQWSLGSGAVEEFNFINSESRTAEQIFNNVINSAPEVSISIEDQYGLENESFSFTVPNNTFSDLNGDDLTFTAEMEDGSALPNWLSFDGATFSGTPENGDVGILGLKVTASDGLASVSTDFNLTVTNVNNAPLSDQGISDVSIAEEQALSLAIPADAFSDLDGDALTYTASLSDGSALPSWLSFDGATFSGTPENGDVGILALKVTASDGLASVSTDFNLTVTNVNDAPLTYQGISDVSIAEEQALSLAIPADAFSDLDGDTLTYTATLSDGSALPGWLSFNGTFFTGTPVINNDSRLTIEVTASDGQASAATHFNLMVTHTNHVPTLSLSLSDQSSVENEAFSFTLPADSFTDVDAEDSLSYKATLSDGSPLPTWLSFDANTLTFGGTPSSGDAGNIHVEVTATDLAGASVGDIFEFDIAPASGPDISSTPVNYVGTSADEVVYGSDFNDTIDGQYGDDTIYGFDGDDNIKGYVGNDLIIGGRGNDTLDGSLGSDIYRFNLGDGQDTISEYRSASDVNVIEFGPGIEPDDIHFQKSSNGMSLEMVVGTGGDKVTFKYFYASSYDPNKPFIHELHFDGGAVLSSTDLARLIPALISEENDWVYGDDGNDVISALGGNDVIFSRAGDDTLEGGLGNDNLYGDAGNDTYVYKTGDGNDIISDTKGINRLVINGQTISQITPINAELTSFEDADGNQYRATRNGSLVVTIGSGAAAGQISIIAWDQDTNNFGISMQAYSNQSPEALDDVGSAIENTPLVFTVAELLSNDSDPEGDALSLTSVSNVLNGTAILDRTAGIVTFTPDSGYVGTASFDYTLSDGELTGSGTVNVTVSAVVAETNDSSTNVSPDPVNYVGTSADEVVYGSDFNDTIDGKFGDDTLYGFDGDDKLKGYIGNDLIVGGKGNDTLDGSIGSDTYLFNLGDGQDSIYEYRSATDINVIKFGAGIAPEDLIFQKSSNGISLDIMVGTGGDKITLMYFYGSSYDPNKPSINEIHFDSGAIYTSADLTEYIPELMSEGKDFIIGNSENNTFDALGGNDTVMAGAGNDHLSGGSGDDWLYGQAGDDTYHFQEGDGFDTIHAQSGSSASDIETLVFDDQFDVNNLWFNQNSNNLEIHLLGTNDKVRVYNWFTSEQHELDFIQSGENTIDSDGIDQLISAMASFNKPSGGEINLSVNDRNQVDTVIAAAWH